MHEGEMGGGYQAKRPNPRLHVEGEHGSPEEALLNGNDFAGSNCSVVTRKKGIAHRWRRGHTRFMVHKRNVRRREKAKNGEREGLTCSTPAFELSGEGKVVVSGDVQ